MKKDQSPNDSFLLDEDPDCRCASSKIPKIKLRHLLKRKINLNNLWNLFPTDEAQKAKRREENTKLQIRLDELDES